MTSVERTAYPIFGKLVLARDLHVFFTPSPDEVVWAREKADNDEHPIRVLGLYGLNP